MQPVQILRSGALLCALAIAAGAFGAHGLKEKVSVKDLETFEIAVRYQMYSALGLLAIAAYYQGQAKVSSKVQLAVKFILVGTLIFSGTLYGIVIGGPRWLGAITPIGGTLLIVGWAILAMNRSHHGQENS